MEKVAHFEVLPSTHEIFYRLAQHLVSALLALRQLQEIKRS